YGGGGITPDEKFTVPKFNPFQTAVLRKFGFFSFTSKYFGTHDTKLSQGWTPDSQVVNDFHQYLLKEGVTFTETEWAENMDWTKRQLRREMYITAFGSEESRKLAVDIDPLVIKAIDSLPKARALQETAKKVVAQRTQDRKPR
ncbi:MAG: S41 family peptidase, partial [Bryobacteraceae bacterium]|nr:S41 family peptidase [Bryobacteraceae bacterium]